MHHHKYRGQHHHTANNGDISDHHVLKEQLGCLKVTIHLLIGTNQFALVHPVHRIQDAVEAHTEITDMPHPAKELCDVHVTVAKSKDREQHRKYRSYKDCNFYGQR